MPDQGNFSIIFLYSATAFVLKSTLNYLVYAILRASSVVALKANLTRTNYISSTRFFTRIATTEMAAY